MEMPRLCSSSSRSVSVPVIRRTSVVLPWSTCPAVPMVRAIRPPVVSPNGGLYGGDDIPRVAGQQGPRVEPDPSLVDPPDDGRIGGAQAPRKGLGLRPPEADGERGDLVQRQRAAAAEGDGGGHVHLHVGDFPVKLTRQ